MSKWVTSAKPAAALTAEADEPETRDDGAKIYYWRTKYGTRFAQIVEPTGFILWLRETT